MERSLKNVVKEVYKNTENNGSFKFTGNNRDKSSNTSETINVSIKNRNSRNNENSRDFLSKKMENFDSYSKNQNYFSLSFIILIILFLAFSTAATAIYFYYDNVMSFLKQYFYDDTKEKELKNQMDQESQKLKGEINSLKKELNDSNKKKTKETENKESPKTYAELKESQKKLYSQDQFVKDHGFCYIGEENNTRHCVEVYNGDICESGDVYKRIDKCMLPEKFA